MNTAPAEIRSDRATRLASLRAALESGTLRGAQRMINALHPAEIAHLLESLPPAQRELAWDMVDRQLDGDVLVELSEEVRAELAPFMGTDRVNRYFDMFPAATDWAGVAFYVKRNP